jgi:hypothetical protein
VFDIGGSAVRVFNEARTIASVETSGVIISASINRNGWFCVCTQESGGFGGAVIAYNDNGRSVFRFDSGVEESGYILSAVLSPDNRSMAVLTLADSGSKVTFFNLDADQAIRAVDFFGTLVLELRYLSGGNVLALSTDSLYLIDESDAARVLFDFSDRRLGGYVLDGDFISLHLLDYGVGHRGRLVTLSDDGAMLGEAATDREIISMSSGGGLLAVLRSDGLVFFDAELSELPPVEDLSSAAGATQVVAFGEGAALAASDHSAVVFRMGGEQ